MPEKPITRRTVRLRRDTLSGDARMAASATIAGRVDVLLATLPAGSIVALYAPTGSEVDTAAIDASARGRGMRIAYPRVVTGDRQLAFHETTIDELVAGRFDLREPTPTAPVAAVPAIAAFVIPGLAFDRAGGRIGWGRGHYDATLAHAAPTALRIGLAFECQLVEAVPRDAHDMPLHYVVTEAAVYRAPH